MSIQVADLIATLRLDDQLSAGLAKAGQTLDGMAGDVKRGSQAAVDSSTREVGRQISGYGKAISGVWDDAIDVAADYSQALADIRAVAGDISDIQFDALNDQIKSLASGTRYNSRETAAAAGELIKAGMTVDDVMSGALEGALDLAAAGGTAVPRAAEVMAQGLNLFGDAMQYVTDRNGDGYIDMLEKAAHFNDVFAKSAATSMTDVTGLGDSFENVGGTLASMGQDFETGVTALTAMSAFGNVGAEAGTSLNSMLTALGKNADMIEAIGVDVVDASGSYRDVLDIFEDMDAILSDPNFAYEDATGMKARNDFLQDVFGTYGKKGAQNLLDYDDKMGVSLTDTEKGLLDQGAAAEMAAARMNSYPGAVEEMAGAQERLQLAFAEPALDAQIPVMGRTADAINGLADAAYDLPAPLRAGLGIMTGLTGQMLEMGGEALYAAPGIRATAEAWQSMKKAPGIAGKLAKYAPLALKATGVAGIAAAAGLAAYQTNFLGFGDAVDALAAQALPALTYAADTAGQTFAAMRVIGLDPVTAAMVAGTAGAAQMARGITEKLGPAIEEHFGPAAGREFDRFGIAVGDTFDAIGQAIADFGKQDTLDAALSTIPASMRRIGQQLQTLGARALDFGEELAVGMGLDRRTAATIRDALGGIGDALTDVLGAGFERLPAIAQGLGDVFGAIGRGDFQAASDQLMAGLQTASDWAMEQLNRGGDWLQGLDIGGKLKDLFQIDASSLGDFASLGATLGSQIGEKLVGGLQGAGGLKDFLVANLPSALGTVKDTLGAAIGDAFRGLQDLFQPAENVLGDGPKGQFGEAAISNVLAGMTNLFGSLKDAITAEFQAAFDAGALPTPSPDFILDPLREMVDAAAQGVGDLFQPLIDAVLNATLAVAKALDQLPNIDLSDTIRQLEDDINGPRARELESVYGAQGAAESARSTASAQAQAIEEAARQAEQDAIEAQVATRAADAALEQAIREFNAMGGRTTELQAVYGQTPTAPPQGPSLGEGLGDLVGGLGAWVRDNAIPLLPLYPAGAAAAGAPGQGADAARGELAAVNAEIAAQEELQRQLDLLVVTYGETAAKWAEAATAKMTAEQAAQAVAGYRGALGIKAADAVSPINAYGMGEGGTGSMGPAGQASYAGKPYVTQLPDVGAGPGAGGAFAGLGQQLVQQAVQAVVAEINATGPEAFAPIQQALQAKMQQAASAPMTSMAPAAASPTAMGASRAGTGPIQGATGAATGGDMGVSQMLAGAQQALQTGLAQLQATAEQGVSQLSTTIATAMQSAATAVQSGAQSIITAVQEIPAALEAAAGAAGAAAASIGQAIVAALDAAVPQVKAAAGRLASAAEVGIDQVVQPGSPSRMALPYGESIGEGLAYGMALKSPEVLAAAKRLGYAAEDGLAPLMDSLSATGAAAGKALGLDMEQVLAEKVNALPDWQPSDQIDAAWKPAFDKAALTLTRYGKRAGDEAAQKAGEAFAGLSGAIGDVLGGQAQYLSEDAAKAALKAYRRLDADAKAKLPDGTKDMLKAAYDEANVTIGDVIKQRMGGRMGQLGSMKGQLKGRMDTILRGMLGQRTLEQKARAAAQDGLSLAIDSIKQGLMQGGQDAQSAIQSAIGNLGGPGEAAKGAMLPGMLGGKGGAEDFAWALCECISGANQEMLGDLGLGDPAKTGVAMLGHDLSSAIGGTGDDFRQAMIDYAKANPAEGYDVSWLGEGANCLSICDQAADTMGKSAGDAAGAAMGASMPAMPSGADMGKAAGGALGASMAQQCVSLCGGTMDDLASGVAGGMQNAGLGKLAMKDATLDLSTGGAKELGKQLRSTIPGAELPGMDALPAGASPDELAGGLADGMTGQCISLCDDSG
ncbi:MAG: phage tail tape measure protein, partial [Variibacter sp.]|nr:phage tail tape measure protein [Variibacter sp.]